MFPLKNLARKVLTEDCDSNYIHMQLLGCNLLTHALTSTVEVRV